MRVGGGGWVGYLMKIPGDFYCSSSNKTYVADTQ